jgi:hypothetical protein
MSIPDNVFKTHRPAPYARLRDRLRSGDIVLCQGKDLFSKLIRWSTQSPWSHVGLVFRIDAVGQILVVEAVEKLGVRAVPLADFVSRDSEGTSPYPGKILFARHAGLTGEGKVHPKAKLLAEFAFGRLGSRFAAAEIARIAARIAAARLLGNHKTPATLGPGDEFICSEFVARAYEHAALPIPWDGLGFIAPADIANDPRVHPVAQADVAHPPKRFGKRSRALRRSRFTAWGATHRKSAADERRASV